MKYKGKYGDLEKLSTVFAGALQVALIAIMCYTHSAMLI
jgi:hypothetical protein